MASSGCAANGRNWRLRDETALIVGVLFVLLIATSFESVVWGAIAEVDGQPSQEAGAASANAFDAKVQYREHVEPLLEKYCYACHGYGAAEGGRTLDAFASDEARQGDRDLWWAVLKNVRAGMMPPAGEEQPTSAERDIITEWVKRGVFEIDPNDPDPGRVTLRRLNRVEYRHTIRDLMGVEFDTNEHFLPDDAGYGFDNIGDVQTVSPLLLEKYLQAAETIVGRAIPLETAPDTKSPAYRRFFPEGPAPDDPSQRAAYARRILTDFVAKAYRRPADEATIDRLLEIAAQAEASADQGFEAGISRAMVAVLASPRFLFRVEAPSTEDANARFPKIDEYALAARLSYFLWSTMPDEELFQLAGAGQLRANLDQQVERMLKDRRSKRLVENFVGQWLRSRDVQNVYLNPEAALGLRGLQRAQRERREAHRAFKKSTKQQIAKLEQERKTLEEQLANRKQGEAAGDAPTDKTDVDGNDDPSSNALRAQQEKRIAEIDGELSRIRAERDAADKRHNEAREQSLAEERALTEARDAFTGDLRRAMRRETEACFEYVMREDRSLRELIDADYSFLNEELARYYDIPGVEGDEMRKVALPEDSPRGGILTQGTLLIVTSNPTRTSPVKRGLHILENVLGAPPPPPPANLPPLEAAASEIKGREPTNRELLEIHRRDPLCHSCHARMDPLGLALENFNALGAWRDQENHRPIDATGELPTGETFDNIGELKRILAENHVKDFYRCLTEKLLTYALGRGLEYYDEHTIDQIVDRLDENDGKFSALLMGIIESPPFQRQRRAESGT